MLVLARDQNRCQGCGCVCAQGEADVHHLIPRSAGGGDDPGNLITLCDGCHAAHHPNLQGTLARRTIERWGMRLAHWVDQRKQLAGLNESVGPTLRLLGLQRFRAPQLEVILAALRGESLLFVSATGSGKSLCFHIPILLQRGLGIVISPLKALMSQQVAGLQLKKIPSTFINSDLSPSEKAIRYQWIREKAVKFLYCTPERFDETMSRPADVRELMRLKPSYLVIDEAHCIDRWGNDFRPNYGQLGKVRSALGNPPVLAFTATAGVDSQKRILESLGVPSARVFVTGVNRPNIALARLDLESEDERIRLIIALLRRVPAGRAMLFVPTVNTGKSVQAQLADQGFQVPFYHSKLATANEREMLLGRFLGRIKPPANVIICTNAFGMGLDVPDVRLVVHWHHPMSMEDYLQEFGRAGRDGKPSVAILFTDRRDEKLLRFMAERSVAASKVTPEGKDQALRAKYHAINQMHTHAVSRSGCFRQAIIRYFGEEPPVERRAFSLRLAEWLFSTSSRVTAARRCCDVCDGVRTDNVIAWATDVLFEGEPDPRRPFARWR